MTTPALRLLTLIATLSVFTSSPLFSASRTNLPIAFPVWTVERHGEPIIGRGITELTVLRLLGASYRKLADGVWAYHGFHANAETAPANECTTLVIGFADGKVIDIMLVNDHAELALTARTKIVPQNQILVASR